jgi:hypothetical protein
VANYIETGLIDDSPASRADIQVVPPRRWLDLSAFPVTGIKAVCNRRIAAYANPRLVIARFMRYPLLGGVHVVDVYLP